MFKPTFILTAACLAMTACAAGPDTQEPKGIAAFEGDPRLGEKVNKICFNSTIDGFRESKRDSVILQRGVSEEYLVTVSRTCGNLRFAQAIGIDSGLSCVRDNDILIVSDSVFSSNTNGMGPDRCFIDEIYRWDRGAEMPETDDSDAG